ncbi:hypothetical protein Dsin_024598 [Dipteronia sinensis]|uniref:Uncharacterized protein n=1 Tax=Dipteronia sinensis TaxID=43782 RepID=A0AAD9ZVS3_9ROSI|nr:hypothetical protein Dsin_024598 [Dipteronia sinensis]
MKELAGRNVIVERGIYLEGLRDIPIPEVVALRQWTRMVLVRGVPVVVSVDRIHAHFELPAVTQEPGEYPNKFHLGSELRTGGGDNWNGHKLLRKDLLLESAFWYLFVSASLKPSVHGSEIFREA